tara:strand:- start:114 stop:401 length:288 start_codon:yes stop_codon:yes gene_type:complete
MAAEIPSADDVCTMVARAQEEKYNLLTQQAARVIQDGIEKQKTSFCIPNVDVDGSLHALIALLEEKGFTTRVGWTGSHNRSRTLYFSVPGADDAS